MRYTNWDVLIFSEAEDTKTPLQEFRTTCEVIQDANAEQIPPSAHSSYFNAVTRPVPIVSCYISSLAIGCPFRVSVHSWDTPTATPAARSMAHHEGMAIFEAKVLIDGTCIAGAVYGSEEAWPQIIVDRKGKTDQLRFPPFHTELLDQTWVNPAQDLGRIKVVIAEGIRPTPASGFDKIRNIVIFSFQHAPLPILQDTGIAWPNHGMWYQATTQFENALSPRKATEIDPDSHAHSPRRHTDHNQFRMTPSSDPHPLHSTNCIDAAGIRHLASTRSNMSSQQLVHLSDPFVGDGRPNGDRSSSFLHWMKDFQRSDQNSDTTMRDRSTLSSSDRDQSMPDYSRPLSPTSLRSVQLACSTRPSSSTGGPGSAIPDLFRPSSFLSRASSRQKSGWEQASSDFGPPPSFLSSTRETERASSKASRKQSADGMIPLAQHAPGDEYNVSGFFEEGMTAYSPDRAAGNGILAPANTRASSAANTPPAATRPSAAKETRDSSYLGKARVVSLTTCDPPPSAVHLAPESSGKPPSTSTTANNSKSENKDVPTASTQLAVHKMPSGYVRGRKEGRASENGSEASSHNQRKASPGSLGSHNKENTHAREEFNTSRGNSKRRRISNNIDSDVALHINIDGGRDAPTGVSGDGSNGSSPVKHNAIDDLTAEGVIIRTPLARLQENIL